MFKVGHMTNIGRKHSDEWNKKVGDGNRGKIVTQETRELMRSIRTGKKASQSTRDKLSKCKTGIVFTEERKSNISKSRLKNKTVKTLDKSGYVMISMREHPYSNKANYIREHRLVMEQYLGRYLLPCEQIHHIDGNKSNNDIKNLTLFPSNSEHRKIHAENMTKRKLYTYQLDEIKNMVNEKKYSIKEIAKMYGVHFATVYKIINTDANKYDGLKCRGK